MTQLCERFLDMKKDMINIRRAEENDSHVIAEINAISWKYTYRDIFPEEMLQSISIDEWAIRWKKAILNNSCIFVISLHNKIVGFAHISQNIADCKNVGKINAIYIHPEQLRIGLGRKLCLASLAELKKLNFKRAVVWVLEKNLSAHQFYEYMKFKKSLLRRPLSRFSQPNLYEIQYIKSLK